MFPFIPRRRKRKKEAHSFILITKKKRENHSFILMLARKAV